jgi:hypothetical protein
MEGQAPDQQRQKIHLNGIQALCRLPAVDGVPLRAVNFGQGFNPFGRLWSSCAFTRLLRPFLKHFRSQHGASHFDF